MTPRKDGSDQNPEERNRIVSFDYEQINSKDGLDTREISQDIEEGDEDLENEELTEADFEIDDDEEEDEE